MATAAEPDLLVRTVHNVKESVARLMLQASVAVQQNAEIDQGMKSSKGTIHGLEKSLEDFYTACDQLHLFLKLIKSAEEQTQHSMKYTPKMVSVGKQDLDQDTQTYSEYLSLVKTQTKVTKELQDMLSDFVHSPLTNK